MGTSAHGLRMLDALVYFVGTSPTESTRVVR